MNARGGYAPRERDEQEMLFTWAALMAGRWPALRLMYHIPNGGSRDVREARRLSGQGVKAGVPDICLPAARGGYHGLFIELKRRKGGRLSEAQEAWIGALRREGYRAEVCAGFEAARRVVEEYMSAG